MRAATLVVALLLGFTTLAAAQEYEEYDNKVDGFKIDFPGQPKVQTTTYETEQNYILPARIYTAETSSGRFSVTAVDYRVLDRLGMERSELCPAGAETCQGQPAGINRAMLGPGYATAEIRDAMFYATFKYIQRGGKITQYLWNNIEVVEGHEIHMTNPDGSRTAAFITMHENRLYIVDATAPKGYPEPDLFVDSLGFVDKDGHAIRYRFIYVNELHGLRFDPPPPIGQGVPQPAAPNQGR